jgi:amino-acid N-acetyltransferase
MTPPAVLTLDALPGENVGDLAATLHEARLPHADLAGADKRFFCASVDGAIVGYVGLEIYGTDALLRSAVVFRAARGNGYGRQMVDALLEIAFEVGVQRVWLLTETATGFFEKAGFVRAPRSLAPPAIAATEEFAAICPGSAAFMLRTL